MGGAYGFHSFNLKNTYQNSYFRKKRWKLEIACNQYKNFQVNYRLILIIWEWYRMNLWNHLKI